LIDAGKLKDDLQVRLNFSEYLENQAESSVLGTGDQGARSAATGGAQMDGL
jgi:carbon monoxide dehydrogenase subunit G